MHYLLANTEQTLHLSPLLDFAFRTRTGDTFISNICPIPFFSFVSVFFLFSPYSFSCHNARRIMITNWDAFADATRRSFITSTHSRSTSSGSSSTTQLALAPPKHRCFFNTTKNDLQEAKSESSKGSSA